MISSHRSYYVRTDQLYTCKRQGNRCRNYDPIQVMIQYDPMKRRISCDLSNRKEADSEFPNAMMYDKHIMRRNEIIMMS